MRQLLLTLSVLFATTVAVAQSQPQRSDITIKSKNLTDAEGNISAVVVSAYAGGKCIQEKTYDMEPALDADLHKIGTACAASHRLADLII